MKIKLIVNNFLWAIGGLWLVALLTIFGLSFFMSWKQKDLDKKYQTKLNTYKSMVEEINLTQRIKYQAKVVARVLENRFEYGKSMMLVNNVFPNSVKVEDIQLSNNHTSFRITGNTSAGTVMDEVEDKISLINSGGVEGLASAEIVSVNVSPLKGWSFTTDLFLK
ncbi:MAG: hypothetical protein KIH89_000025 [Candidatus Shapirobacteria bacterium]|nr:hypothetical protein [Candidatus Shapirobacteria bacterium]